MKKKAFTLVELLISIIIIWFLIVLIFRIYVQVANVSIRIENEKILNTEMLSFFQTLQTIWENYKIDYAKYGDSLVDKYWLTSVIYLTWNQWWVSIYSTWTCGDDISWISAKNCWIQMNKNWNIVDLTDRSKVYFSKLYFKVIPFKDVSTYNVPFDQIYHNWFAVYLESYIKRYKKGYRPFEVKVNYSNFFNLRKY